MFSNLRFKLAVPVICILLVLIASTALFVAQSVQEFSYKRSEERLLGKSQAVQYYVNRLVRLNEMTAHALSGRQTVITLLRDWNNGINPEYTRQALIEYLDAAIIELGVTAAVVTAQNGYILIRTHDPEHYGDYGRSGPLIGRIFQGYIDSSWGSSFAMPINLSSGSPILDAGEIIGTMGVTRDLSHHDFVEELADVFNAVVTTFARSTSVSTTFFDSEGVRAVGFEAHPLVVYHVLEHGRTFDLERAYPIATREFYFPLFNTQGDITGMIAVGFSVQDALDETSALVINLLFISIIGVVIAAAVMLAGVTQIQERIYASERSAIEADAASKAKSNFLSTISHEIRTPISAILGIAEIQLKNPDVSTDLHEALDKISVSGEMLLSIINDILDLSRIEEGRMDILPEKYEVASLISDTSMLNMMRFDGKQIQFEVEVDENIPACLIGDELRVKQILNNILSNAFKYTNEGRVTMSVGGTADKNHFLLEIIITDTGQGMTEEQVETLFDKYTRFNHKANRTTEGAGLGMSITGNLIALMGGTIFVKSRPGQGSAVTLCVPQEITDTAKLGNETARNLKQFKNIGNLRKKTPQFEIEPMPYGKVLVVDDMDANIYVAKGFLAPYEVQVDQAKSGKEALEKITTGSTYDLILMDHMMPQMDGVETTLRLRAMGCNTPIVAYTANAIIGQQDEFMKNGFNGFISKPIRGAHLNYVLVKFIRNKQSTDVLDASKSKAVPGRYVQRVNFVELRKDFAKCQQDTIPELKFALAQNDYTTAHRLAHTLKGLAGLIGETALVNLARAMEKAVREQNVPDQQIETLSAELAKVLAKIGDVQRVQTKTRLPVPSPAEISAIFAKLEQLLLENSAEAIGMVDRLSAIPGAEELVEHIENFNFEIALECLEQLTITNRT